MNLQDEMRKVFLAGVGAVATTAEKAQELVEKLVEKGELTVSQGKDLNEELKKNFKDKAGKAMEKTEQLIDKVDTLSSEQLKKLKEKIEQLENKTK